MFFGSLYIEFAERHPKSGDVLWDNKVSFKVQDYVLNNMINLNEDSTSGIKYKDGKKLKIDIINKVIVLQGKYDDSTESYLVLSTAQSKSLSLMMQKAKERIYGW